ncbi:thioredoxin family protein [Lignipirellula cremea]|uniref:Thioredoxin n=1 Tax=Lignipirellula cremea TaxID=2528010 RepID=A0A518E100_9BACT|nr:thioredoxin family protein [Lignipirellula cremea]QDU97731.1 Thioredoxin [Lignipirellula cremea]
MTGLTAALVLQAMLLAPGAQPYSKAYANSVESGRPMLVLVGAKWCPACVEMKKNVLPAMVASGDLEGVEFAMVDADEQNSLASTLMRGDTIPQLILFEKTATGWKRQQLTGKQARSRISGLIRPALTRYASYLKQVSARTVIE